MQKYDWQAEGWIRTWTMGMGMGIGLGKEKRDSIDTAPFFGHY
jgi:hypothetical protein